jgi:hypothetical protein
MGLEHKHSPGLSYNAGQHCQWTGLSAWTSHRVQYPQDGNALLHIFFRVLQITYAWAALAVRNRPPSAAIVTVCVGNP